MQATLAGRAVVIVLLDSWGKYTRTADAARIRSWLEVAAGYTSPSRHATSTRKAAKVSARASANRSATQKTALRNKPAVRRSLSVASAGRPPAFASIVHQRQPVQPPRPAGVVSSTISAPAAACDDVLKDWAHPRFIPTRWS
jgi:D-alanyl-D-alanine carboxypeptidase